MTKLQSMRKKLIENSVMIFLWSFKDGMCFLLLGMIFHLVKVKETLGNGVVL